jgi:hypothetical protein
VQRSEKLTNHNKVLVSLHRSFEGHRSFAPRSPVLVAPTFDTIWNNKIYQRRAFHNGGDVMGGNKAIHLTLIIVSAVAVAASSAGCASNQTTLSPTSSVPANFLLYSNKNAGVQINYPSDWQLTQTPVVGIALFTHGDDSILFRIQSNQTNQTAQSLAQSLLSDTQKSYNNVSVLENHSASLGGLPGYKIVTQFKSGNYTYKALTVTTIKGNLAYLIQFSGVAAQYDQQNATAQQMISSFKFT